MVQDVPHDQEKIYANSVNLSGAKMRKGCASLADFSDSTEVAAMLRVECAKYFQSSASMTR